MSYENVKHLQKTMHHTTECDVAVAQVRVSFFICFGMFLIALVEKLMPEIQLTVAVFSMQQIILKNGMASAFSLEQLLLVFWQIKNDTLTGNFGFVGNKMAFTLGKLTEIESLLLLTKAMQILPI